MNMLIFPVGCDSGILLANAPSNLMNQVQEAPILAQYCCPANASQPTDHNEPRGFRLPVYLSGEGRQKEEPKPFKASLHSAMSCCYTAVC